MKCSEIDQTTDGVEDLSMKVNTPAPEVFSVPEQIPAEEEIK